MANTIQIKRGLEADRSSVTPAAGELLYTTDTKQVFVGDGSTAGGNAVGGGGGASIEATASGALANGDMVVVNSDGTVSAIAYGSTNEFTSKVLFSDGVGYPTARSASNGSGIILYVYEGTSNTGYVRAVKIAGTGFIFGEETEISSTMDVGCDVTYDSTNDQFVVTYEGVNSYGYARVVVVDSDDLSVTFGTEATFNAVVTNGTTCTYDPVNDVIVIGYGYSTTSLQAVVASVSGTTLSFGTPTTFNTGDLSTYDEAFASTYHAASGNVVFIYGDDGNSEYPTAIVGSVSGTSISFGTAVVLESFPCRACDITYDSDQEAVVAVFDGSNAYVVAGTVSGTTLTFGTAVGMAAINFADSTRIEYSPHIGKSFVIMVATANSKYNLASVSGTTTTLDFSAPSQDLPYLFGISYSSALTYDSASKNIVISGHSAANFAFSAYQYVPSSNLTAYEFVGISDGAYADTATATIQIVGAIDDAQTGLTAGTRYYVQRDGTISSNISYPENIAGTAISSTQLIVKG